MSILYSAGLLRTRVHSWTDKSKAPRHYVIRSLDRDHPMSLRSRRQHKAWGVRPPQERVTRDPLARETGHSISICLGPESERDSLQIAVSYEPLSPVLTGFGVGRSNPWSSPPRLYAAACFAGSP